MSPRVVPDAEPVWRALADPTRRAILDVLRTGPHTTSALAEGFPTTRFAVMKHLGVLVEAGLVTVERRGRERLNHLDPTPLRRTCERWLRPAAGGTESMSNPAPGWYGLDVRARHTVHTDPGRTWAALLDLAAWWPGPRPDGARLVFEPRIGGRLGTTTGRTLDDGGRGALWGVVSGLHPGRELRVDGAMDIPGPVVGQWRVLLDPAPGATVVAVEHRVLGPVDDGTAAEFTRRWPTALAALATRAETL